MENLGKECFEALAKKNAETLLFYLNDTDGWKVCKRTRDALVESKLSVAPGFEHGHLYRAQSEYNCPKEILHKYLHPIGGPSSELRRKWDKDVADLQALEHVTPEITVNMVRTNSAAMGLIHPREFVDLIYESKDSNYVAFNCVSVDYPPQPLNPKFVRGWNHPSGFFCLDIPGQPGRSRFVALVQADIKGNLPRSLVESAIPGSMAGLFNNLRQKLKKDGHLS